MMNKNNCPNCGSPIKHIYSHKCSYCGTLLNSNNIGDRQDINLRNVHNIELCCIEREFATNSIYMIFRGIESNIRPMYEVENTKAVIFNKTQDVKFGLAIPIYELRDGQDIFTIIESRIPNEIIDEVMYSIEKYITRNQEWLHLFRWCR